MHSECFTYYTLTPTNILDPLFTNKDMKYEYICIILYICMAENYQLKIICIILK